MNVVLIQSRNNVRSLRKRSDQFNVHESGRISRQHVFLVSETNVGAALCDTCYFRIYYALPICGKGRNAGGALVPITNGSSYTRGRIYPVVSEREHARE